MRDFLAELDVELGSLPGRKCAPTMRASWFISSVGKRLRESTAKQVFRHSTSLASHALHRGLSVFRGVQGEQYGRGIVVPGSFSRMGIPSKRVGLLVLPRAVGPNRLVQLCLYIHSAEHVKRISGNRHKCTLSEYIPLPAESVLALDNPNVGHRSTVLRVPSNLR